MNVYERLTAVAETEGFKDLAERLADKSSAPKILLSGVQGAGVAHFVALLPEKIERDVIVVVPDQTRARSIATNIRSLCSLISHQTSVINLPYLDVEAYSKTEPHFQVVVERAVAFHLLSGQKGVKILITTHENLIYPSPPAPQFAGKVMNISRENEAFMEDIVRYLEFAGYRRRGVTEGIGEYSVRGGIIDAFSPLYQAPVRMEFSGDEIDSLRVFDPSNQLSIEEIDEYRLAPVTEFDLEKMIHDKKESGLFEKASYFFSYDKVYKDTSHISAYLSNPAVVFTDYRGAMASIQELRKHFKTRFKSAEEESSEASPPERLLIGDEILDKILGDMRIVYLSDSGGARTDKEITLEITGLDWTASLGLGGDSIKNIAGEAMRFDQLVIFAADGNKAAALMENEHLAPVKPAMITVPPIEGSARWRISGFLPHIGTAQEADVPSKRTGADIFIDIGEKPALIPLPFDGSYKFEGLNIGVIGSTDLFAPEAARRKTKKRKYFSFSLQDMKEGDYVIHYEHGVGLYHGLKKIERDGIPAEFMELEYAEKHLLYVPLERMDLIDRYISLEGVKPHLDSLTSKKWINRRQRVKKSLFDMARTLLNLYASRQLIKGWKFASDTALQHKFESLFPYQETEDQLHTIEDVKQDMESSKPMDRLVVGDVGFGKTEVALRAAFKAASEGKQTAIIAPTTILAYQHHRNFKSRLEGFPFKVAMMSRLVEKGEQKKNLEEIGNGSVNIVVGTHRLLSNDVKFHNLGLLVIDEEQRFGVNHKEKIKMMRHHVDVITLTATPIPRTLNLAMMGIRDLSVIETPPENRLSVKTEIVPFDEEILAEAIHREISRGGQVYFVHNRVDNIEMIRDSILAMSPGARVVIAHGQMAEAELERVMLGFISGEADILLSTTIIENGIDIPNVNTLIVNNAHRFGLAQLYQLRGRVGRSERQAYCYLVVPEYSSLSVEARARLQTLIEFSRLGSGFRIAAIDMEMRGSGNILGDEQSGHITEVGFDLYCRMLEEAVADLKGEAAPKTDEMKPSIELQANIALPENYIPQTDQRLALYRRISSADTEEGLERIKAEVMDRYGKPPKSFFRLLDYGWLRVNAEKYAISKIGRDGDRIRFKIEKTTTLGPKEIYSFCSRRPGSVFLPDGQLVITAQGDDPLKAAKTAMEELIALRP